MSQRIRVVVVDDEPLAREGIRRLLESDAEVAVVAECANGAAAVEAIARLAPEIVFLDVQMPEMDGFDVLRAVGPGRIPAVVFVTAYDRYALQAFEVHALDYLLKPFDDERFAAALARAKREARTPRTTALEERLLALLDRGSPPAGAADAPTPLARIVVKSQGRVVFVRVDEIDWIEAADYYAKLHVGGKVHLLRETMGALETRLDPKRFFRVHRSAIVNLDRVKEIQPYFRGEHVLLLRDGSKLKLSKGRKEKLEALLQQSI